MFLDTLPTFVGRPREGLASFTEWQRRLRVLRLLQGPDEDYSCCARREAERDVQTTPYDTCQRNRSIHLSPLLYMYAPRQSYCTVKTTDSKCSSTIVGDECTENTECTTSTAVVYSSTSNSGGTQKLIACRATLQHQNQYSKQSYSKQENKNSTHTLRT